MATRPNLPSKIGLTPYQTKGAENKRCAVSLAGCQTLRPEVWVPDFVDVGERLGTDVTALLTGK